MNISSICYGIGALLYCPANNTKIADYVISEKFGNKYSLALCLEDTIGDDFVGEAENILIESLRKIFVKHTDSDFYLPKIFIRIRSYKQIESIISRLSDAGSILTGFIFPKFCPENADKYIDTLMNVNEVYNLNMYMMPILESPAMINLKSRYDILYLLKEKLDNVKSNVLNIRVGGNDLCHIFGFRRHVTESIHKIRPVSDIFSDIITIFGTDYVVSGPVWEYYNGDGWDTGLRNELIDDKLCGFIGKTVIHPKQIEVVNNAYKVPQSDVNDAKSILGWDKDSASYVSANTSHSRMNEYKTHSNWALRTLMLSEHYGII